MNKAYDIVALSRKQERPTSSNFIEYIFEDFIEMHGDRCFADDSAIIGGIGMLNGKPITIIGIQKGNSLEENIERNFGQVKPEGYRKALRLMKQAEKFDRPIVCLINTPGAYCGVDAEKHGQGLAIAKNLFEMTTISVPIISIIIGEGGSGGALALAVADKVWMLKNSTYSILSPEGFASILWKDSKRSKEAAGFMKLTSEDLLEMKVIDKIIDEAKGGVDKDFIYTADILQEEIIKELNELSIKDKKTLIDERYKRFRKYGNYFSLED